MPTYDYTGTKSLLKNTITLAYLVQEKYVHYDDS
jgi:hypothetical protein